MPKLLVDESTGKKLFFLLKKSNYNVKYAGEIFKGALDEKVLAYSKKNKLVLITDDKDFGELVFRSKHKAYSVVLIRIKTTNHEFRFNKLKQFFNSFTRFESRFFVLSETMARIRRIKN